MPIYEFECPKHGRFESLENNLIDNLRCPACGKIVPRVPSVPAVAAFKEPMHSSGAPMGMHNAFVRKNRDIWHRVRSQSKLVQPEDM